METIKKISAGLAFGFLGVILLFLFLFQFPRFREKFIEGEVRASPPVKESEATCSLTLCSEIRDSAPERPRRVFELDEKIFVFASFGAVSPGRHTAFFHWINPRGKRQETYQKEFHTSGGNYRCWSWIQLHSGLPVSAGPLGSDRYLGPWSVKTYLDGVFLAEAAFEVR